MSPRTRNHLPFDRHAAFLDRPHVAFSRRGDLRIGEAARQVRPAVAVYVDGVLLELQVLLVERESKNLVAAGPVELREGRAAQENLVRKDREWHEAGTTRKKCEQARHHARPTDVEDIVENRDAVRRKAGVGDLQIVERERARVPAVEREESEIGKSVFLFGAADLDGGFRDGVDLRARKQILQVPLKRREASPARVVEIEVLAIEQIDRDHGFIRARRRDQRERRASVMDADLGDVARKARLLLEPDELHHGERRRLVHPAFDAIRISEIAIGGGEPGKGWGCGLAVHARCQGWLVLPRHECGKFADMAIMARGVASFVSRTGSSCAVAVARAAAAGNRAAS